MIGQKDKTPSWQMCDNMNQLLWPGQIKTITKQLKWPLFVADENPTAHYVRAAVSVTDIVLYDWVLVETGFQNSHEKAL